METLPQDKKHELWVELKAAIRAELDDRELDYKEKNPCTRLSDDETHVYTISGEDLEEEAQEDAIQTFMDDLDHACPKLYNAIWEIMSAERMV